MQQSDSALKVQVFLEAGQLREPAFVNRVQFLCVAAAAPVIADGVLDDLAQKRARISDFKLFSKGLNRLERGVLFEVFVVQRAPRPLGSDADQQSNLTGIDVHVTNLRSARLYVT